MSAETNILRHELAEARRKLDAERVNTDNAYIKLAEVMRECEQLRKDNADLLGMLKATQLRPNQNLRINCNHD